MDQEIILLGDYHLHSIFSDGVNTFDELSKAAKMLNLETIAVCDHSDEYMQSYNAPRLQGFYHGLHRWHNIFNDVKVIRGLEIDLLDEDGKISDMSRYRHRPSFIILSAHRDVFKGNSQKVSKAYVNAIIQNHEIINILGHPCSTYFGSGSEGINIKETIEIANSYGIGVEVNGGNLISKKTDLDKLKYMCLNAKFLYINSDAHSTYEIWECRKQAIEVAISFGRFTEIEKNILTKWCENPLGNWI